LDAGIIDTIKQYASQKRFPDNTLYTSISVQNIEKIAVNYKVRSRDIEITALESDIVPERYTRNMKSLSVTDQAILLKSTVGIVGLGGLGGMATEILARIGIGKLILIDGDSFEESNLNRQLLSSHDKIGFPKAEAAEKRVREINSSVETRYHIEYLSENNGAHLIEGSDVIVDCLDNLKTRFTLEQAAKKNKSPLVSGAVAGNTGQVTTIFPEDSGLNLIYGNPGTLPEKGVEATLGTLPHAVTLVSTLECAEVIKILLNKGGILRNKLLIINPFENLFEVMELY